ncbi:MAG: histidine--tRNA ligase [Candidatus Marinimicrobia bacterium]|nr:histidine--tRNA ligase [Candidatus Neomarinimicrobiota bacterium]
MIRSLKGTYDILPDESWRWQTLEAQLHDFMSIYGYKEIRTPAFEKTELFSRGVGEETDIVSKEMYTWLDGGKTNLTLKPELTAPVVRSYIQHNLGALSPVTKLYYMDALFRRERPQKGRQRQFHQFGVEALGTPFPEADAEVIAIAYEFMISLGITNLKLKLNSIGSGQCRTAYKDALKEYLSPHIQELSETSRLRFETNPLRILDTKIEHEIELLGKAPDILGFLTADDETHFSEVRELLDGMKIPYVLDKRMVRGLDYYTRTTFEITSSALGSQDALCGGGRYDKLVETLGGKSTPAVGFAAGVERLLIALDEIGKTEEPSKTDIYFVGLGDQARKAGIKLVHDLRKQGYKSNYDLVRRSMKAQMRESNKSGARIVLILGDQELENNQIQIKDLENSQQMTINLDELKNHLYKLEL